MADITLKYLTDLSSASNADEGDLLHINQSGNDRSITVEVLLNAMFNMRYPIGKVEWFANDVNPNTIWTGSTWARLPGNGRTVRLANETGSDVLHTGGSDNLTLTEANLPQHSHQIDLKTSQFDYGAKTTSTMGAHVHVMSNIMLGGINNKAVSGGSTGSWGSKKTDAAGNHNHRVDIGAHSHDVKGSSGTSGSGAQANITNSFIKLAGWYRTA
ncbi:phage baseplate protein [Hafnia alvei]|uniref:Baseplate structural protein Gp10 C-terminal domain-containing protein n=1 Tax=Hafnia alvei ATCC 51873 TaxID=1002364 RepID=G9YA87_HAFAL|nr:hypothetical protein [Hafnia alvei]EHM40217.1 hypothetical protein HMPREF0454_03508 [Hafnia alvei ATCC 51873]QQE45352.1 hypothetical protein I6H95_08735 [Hafnia alvei]